MFSEKVKSEIELITKKILEKNLFIQKARDGELTKAHISRYLKNIQYSIHHTPIHLQAAANRSRELGLEDIALFMEEKFKEEYGHNKWVEADILKIGGNTESEIHLSKDLTKGIVELINYVETLVQNDPSLYIAYMTFIEYFTVLVAPEFLSCVENKCGILKSTLTVVAKHGELDKAHTEDDLNAIEVLVNKPENRIAFINVIHKTAEILNRHFTECAEAA